MLDRLRRAFEFVLELVVILLMVALSALIIAGFVFRYADHSLTCRW